MFFKTNLQLSLMSPNYTDFEMGDCGYSRQLQTTQVVEMMVWYVASDIHNIMAALIYVYCFCLFKIDPF